MNRCIKRIAVLVIAAGLSIIPVSAQETYSLDILSEQYEASGVDDIYDALPEETEDYLDQFGLDDAQSIAAGMDMGSLANTLTDMAKESADGPVAACGVIIAAIILCAVIESMRDSRTPGSPAGAASAAACAAVCAAVIVPVAAHIEAAIGTILAAGSFAGVFSAVFAAVITVGGGTATGAGYSAFMLSMTSGTSAIITAVVLPVMRIFLSLAAVSALSPALNLSGMLTFIEKNLKWLLTIIALIFVGLLGVSSVAAAAADGATVKAARFAIASSVPVIGNAIGDAVSTVQSCMGILRTTIGGFGIVALGITFLPVIIKTGVWSLAIGVCSLIAELFSAKPVVKLLSSVSVVLSLLMAVTIFVAFILIAASAIVLKGYT